MHQGARALQAGLQPAEQRAAEGQAKTTLSQTWQRRHVVARLAGMTERLGSLAREHGATLEALGRLGPAIHEVATRAVTAIQPVLQLVSGQMRERRRHAIEQQHEQERAARPSLGPGLGM